MQRLSSHLVWIFIHKVCQSGPGVESQPPTTLSNKPRKKLYLAAVPGSLFWRDLFLKCFAAVISFLSDLSLIQLVLPSLSQTFSEGQLLAYGSCSHLYVPWCWLRLLLNRKSVAPWVQGKVFHITWSFNYRARWQPSEMLCIICRMLGVTRLTAVPEPTRGRSSTLLGFSEGDRQGRESQGHPWITVKKTKTKELDCGNSSILIYHQNYL